MKIEIEITEAEIKSAIERTLRVAIAGEVNGWQSDQFIKERVKRHWKEVAIAKTLSTVIATIPVRKYICPETETLCGCENGCMASAHPAEPVQCECIDQTDCTGKCCTKPEPVVQEPVGRVDVSVNSTGHREQRVAIFGDVDEGDLLYAAPQPAQPKAEPVNQVLLDVVKSADEVIDWLVLHLRAHHHCKHTDPTWSGVPAWIDKARAAIAAAEGDKI